MERFMSVVMVVGVVAAVILQCAAAQTVHVVGDGIGWTIPPGGAAAYTTWAASKTFVVGDILMFNFSTNAHDVLQVPKASYDACSSANPIGNLITTGPANFTLTSAGDHFYICTFSQHCQLGQKLTISVSASQGASPPSATTPTPTPPANNTPPATPSPTSGSPAACPPVPALSPKADGPTVHTTPTSPTPPADGPTPSTPGSFASGVSASVWVTFLFTVMGLLL